MSCEFGFEPTMTQPYYFISYNSQDVERVAPICCEMNARGIPMWYDKGLISSEKWERQITENIRNCKEVILFVTSKMMIRENTYVRKEFIFAQRFEKNVRVVMLDEIDFNKVNDNLKGWFLDLELLNGIYCTPNCDVAQLVDKIEANFHLIRRASADADTPQGSSSPERAAGLRGLLLQKRMMILSVAAVIICLVVPVILFIASLPKYDDPVNYLYEVYPDYVAITGLKNDKMTVLRIPESIEEKPVREIAGSAFKEMKQLERVYIPDTVTQIGASSFFGCENLVYVDLSNCVEAIECFCFAKCGKLKEVVIPDSVTIIGHDCFADCNSLRYIDIPDSVREIEYSAFYGCTSLEYVNISDSVEKIGEDAFCFCNHQTGFNVSPDNRYFSSVDGVLFNREQTVLLRYPSNKNAKSYAIPDTVEEIGYNAFFYCTKLKEITIPDSVIAIRFTAFSMCTGISHINIPASVETIEVQRFSSSYYGVYSTTGVSGIHVAEDNPYFSSVDGVLYDKDRSTLLCYPGVKEGNSFSVPSSVKAIGEAAFVYCQHLQKITLPDSVKSIDGDAFSGCSELLEITVPPSVTRIKDSAFSQCDHLTVCGKSGSYAEKYAKKKNIPFKAQK